MKYKCVFLLLKYFDFLLEHLKLYYIAENKKYFIVIKDSGQNNAVFTFCRIFAVSLASEEHAFILNH